MQNPEIVPCKSNILHGSSPGCFWRLFVHRRGAHFRMRSWRLGARLQLHLAGEDCWVFYPNFFGDFMVD